MNRPTSIPWWAYLAFLLLLGAGLLFVPMVRCGAHLILTAKSPEEAAFMLRYSAVSHVVTLNGERMGGNCPCCGQGRRISLWHRWTWKLPR